MFSSKSLVLLLALLFFVSCNFLESDIFHFPKECETEKVVAKRDVGSVDGDVVIPEWLTFKSIFDNPNIIAK